MTHEVPSSNEWNVIRLSPERVKKVIANGVERAEKRIQEFDFSIDVSNSGEVLDVRNT